jgi:BASS family bile acid:Na+ symporter
MASNVLTLASRGNVSYSVSLTTSATLLSPLVVPVALRIALSTEQSIDTAAIFVKLLTTVVGPVLLGHALCRFSARLEAVMSRIGPGLANLAILWIIAVVVGLNRDRLHDVTGGLLIALLALNVLGYLAGYAGAATLRLNEPMRRALTLEVGMQNAGLGTILVLELFPEGAAIPTAAYTFGCMLTGSMLAQYWSRRTAPADEH